MPHINFCPAASENVRNWLIFTVGVLMAGAALAAPTDDFVTTWKTDNPGTSGPTEITIPMVGGPYDVDWDNDGIFDDFDLNGSVTHDFTTAGTYTVRIRGLYSSIRFAGVGDAGKILSIDQWGTGVWQTMERAFQGAVNLQIPATDTPDFSAVTSMAFMFDQASAADPDTSDWDTANVTSMAFMFNFASSANPDTGAWNTAAVTDMAFMFNFADSANPDTSDWDTSNVTTMRNMFTSATEANPDTSGWNTSNVTDMQLMFQRATSANPDTRDWDTTNVSNMRFMFRGATAANPDTSTWNTSNVADTRFMFLEAAAANPDTSGWNVQSLEDAGVMFDASGLTTANYEALLEAWSEQTVQPNVRLGANGIAYCSADAASARSVLTSAPNNWTITDQGQDCSEYFVTTWKTDNPGTSGPTEITIPMVGGPYDVDWDNDGTFDQTGLTDSVTHDFGVAGTYTVRIRGSYSSIRFALGGDAEKLLSIDQWGTRPWQTMDRAFDGAVNLQVPATDTPDFSAVTSMRFMFRGAAAANPDTSDWETSSVTSMAFLFSEVEAATPDTSGWDTSNVTDMRSMFSQASSADPDTSGWTTSNVTNMRAMFAGATAADPDTSGWDTASVTNMRLMFAQATAANPDTSNWNTSNVTDMSFMFSGAAAANPDISGWNVQALEDASFMFDESGLTTARYETLLENWSGQTVQPNVSLGASTVAYCSDAAAAGRAILTGEPNNWTIDDQGQACFADLSVTKSDGLDVIRAGEPISYTITVTNAGPEPVIGASVTDQLPPELLNPTVDCTPAAGAACTIIGPTEIEVDLPVGASVTIDLSTDVDPTAVGIIINEVTVNVPDNIADPDPDNNQATDETATDGLFKDRFEGEVER
jgi:uncharacterized repeat protein (TIGR01451 family)